MNTNLKNKIESIKPEFYDNNNIMYPLPKSVSLYLNDEDYLIELTLNKNVLETNICIGEEQYELTDSDVDFIYNYLNEILEHQIDLTKFYYNEELYNQNYI